MSSVGDNVSDLDSSSEDSDSGDKLKSKMRRATKTKPGSFKQRGDKFGRGGAATSALAKRKIQTAVKTGAGTSGGQGHIVKFSASAYKSQKGQGDTLKAGKYEPFAYIQLNPKMLNKRNKTKAIKSFEGVVSHGKKVDKRKNNKESGMLSGIAFKK